jgi:hypothetical protein
MEEEEGKYEDGKIYKIYVLGLEDFCYIGSTIIPLNDRLRCHRHAANNKYKFASAPLFEEGNEVVIDLVEEYPCNTKQELLEREAYWILQYPEAINKNTPILTPEERHRRQKARTLAGYYKNREHNIAKHKEWIAANHEKIAAQRAAYAPIQKEKGKLREALPENRAKRNAAKKVIATCELCQKEMNKNSLWEHKKRVHTPGANPLQNIST